MIAAVLSKAMCSFSGNFSRCLRCRVSNSLKKSVFQNVSAFPKSGVGSMIIKNLKFSRTILPRSKWQCYDAYCRVCMGLGQCPSSLGQVLEPGREERYRKSVVHKPTRSNFLSVLSE